MAQRVLSAANLEQAQLGTALAGFMKAIPVFITGPYILLVKMD